MNKVKSSIKRKVCGGVQRYSVIILLFFCSFIFIACSSPNTDDTKPQDQDIEQVIDNKDPDKDKEDTVPENENPITFSFTDSEKSKIKTLKSTSIAECETSIQTLLAILNNHKSEAEIAEYITVTQGIYDVLTQNKSVFSATYPEVPEKRMIPDEETVPRFPENLTEYFTASDGTQMYYTNFRQYQNIYNSMWEKYDLLKRTYDYAYTEMYNNYKNALNANPVKKAHAYLNSFLKDIITDYDIDGIYSKETLNQIATDARNQDETIAAAKGDYEVNDSIIIQMLNDYNTELTAFTTFALISKPCSESGEEDPYNPDDPVITPTEYYKVSFVTNCDTTLDSVEFPKNKIIYVENDTLSGSGITADISLYKEGYYIENWYFDAEFTEPINSYFALTDNTTLYAKWEPGVTIFFETNCEQKLKPLSIPKGSRVQLNIHSIVISTSIYYPKYKINLKKENHVLSNWYTDSSLTTEATGNAYITLTQDITLYAKWEEGVTINFVTNCETEIESITIPKGISVTPSIDYTSSEFYLYSEEYNLNDSQDYPRLVEQTKLKNGNQMLFGWYKDTALTQEFGYEEINTDTTIYAKYAQPVTLSFVTNCDTQIEPMNFPKGLPIKMEGEYYDQPGFHSFQISGKRFYLTNDNWYFGGWYFNENFEDRFRMITEYNDDSINYTDETYTLNADTTLYAYWPELDLINKQKITVSQSSPFTYSFNVSKWNRYFIITSDSNSPQLSYDSDNKTSVNVSVALHTNEIYTHDVKNHYSNYGYNFFTSDNDTCTVTITPASGAGDGDAYIWIYKEIDSTRNFDVQDGINVELIPFEESGDIVSNFEIDIKRQGDVYTFSLLQKNDDGEYTDYSLYNDVTWYLGTKIIQEWNIHGPCVLDMTNYPPGKYIVTADFGPYNNGNTEFKTVYIVKE